MLYCIPVKCTTKKAKAFARDQFNLLRLISLMSDEDASQTVKKLQIMYTELKEKADVAGVV